MMNFRRIYWFEGTKPRADSYVKCSSATAASQTHTHTALFCLDVVAHTYSELPRPQCVCGASSSALAKLYPRLIYILVWIRMHPLIRKICISFITKFLTLVSGMVRTTAAFIYSPRPRVHQCTEQHSRHDVCFIWMKHRMTIVHGAAGDCIYGTPDIRRRNATIDKTNKYLSLDAL